MMTKEEVIEIKEALLMFFEQEKHKPMPISRPAQFSISSPPRAENNGCHLRTDLPMSRRVAPNTHLVEDGLRSLINIGRL